MSNPFGAPPPIDKSHITEQRRCGGMLAELRGSVAFKWFLEKCVGAKADEQQRIALDGDATDDAARLARKIRKALVEVATWTDEQGEATNAFLASIPPA